MYIEQDYSRYKECLLFIEDTDNGCLCLCPCGEEVEVTYLSKYCPVCKQEHKYPAWASW